MNARFGGLSSYRLCRSAAEPLVHFQHTAQNKWPCSYTALFKKGFSIGDKEPDTAFEILYF